MSYSFANIPKATPPRSTFRRNHNLKTTINTDYLYPIYVDEALPGDVFKFKEHLFARLSTPLCPIMDNLYLDTFYFAIPVRLVDSEFKKLMGERPFGDVRNDYSVPQLEVSPSTGSLSDYLGLPLADNFSYTVCPWWHRSYNLVFNEWFRDENLVPARPVAGVHEDGTVTGEVESDYILCRRGKRKDYYTGATPWPQKGAAAQFPIDLVTSVSVPSSGSFVAASHEVTAPLSLKLGAVASGSNYTPAQFTSQSSEASIGSLGYSSNDQMKLVGLGRLRSKLSWRIVRTRSNSTKL